ncbi:MULTISPECIES: phosphonate ABC transporter, permease protein PhnE [unclassified Herbaspirillum]|uniref:phosphonate ABC transporter, permease protein PhnE n=1 Tax=unclassified Herbaspirillum TaxID=2624150 RepID=UPI001152D545|nr:MULTISPECIES: phosphonate ABC transporter, permease protein PhnE [unclassified Herbaspirillum]MBB5393407.1 phosphonate transport system permease protein [Herbaspirillum sp. SJZ102]TQK03845.1 phosphonate transport system permease protein [Herbaspirillum sp. SJZ130]TQK08577.1 phosphonate transport system permease protein [Herbaspirillum sp. SJZ106]
MNTPMQSVQARSSYHDYIWTGPRPLNLRSWLLCVAAVALAALVLAWSAQGTQLSWSELASGLPQIGDFLSRSFPPNWSILGNLLDPAIETVQIALWGTLLGVLGAIPVSFLAARNLNRNRVVYQGVRQLLNVTRSINELILALVFVSAVGLGPFPGVLALALHGVGMVGKFFAESIEEIDDGPLEALRATGARPLQVIAFGVLPQVITAWIATVLYRFEVNLRQATVLGMVGAGGLGFELVNSLKLFKYQDTATCIVVVTLMVVAADTISSRLRQLIQDGRVH